MAELFSTSFGSISVNLYSNNYTVTEPGVDPDIGMRKIADKFF
jgi:hypothetical protein